MSLKEYVAKNIFSISLTYEDIINGKTGFYHHDNLTPHEREKARMFFRKKRESMTPEEKAKGIAMVQRLKREKKHENNNALMNVANLDVWRDFINSITTPELLAHFR